MIAVVYSCGKVLFDGCEKRFDYRNQVCGGPCFQLEKQLEHFTWSLPFFTTPSDHFFSRLLVVRRIYQKRRMQKGDIWRKKIRMLVQLLTVSL